MPGSGREPRMPSANAYAPAIRMPPTFARAWAPRGSGDPDSSDKAGAGGSQVRCTSVRMPGALSTSYTTHPPPPVAQKIHLLAAAIYLARGPRYTYTAGARNGHTAGHKCRPPTALGTEVSDKAEPHITHHYVTCIGAIAQLIEIELFRSTRPILPPDGNKNFTFA